MLFWGLVSLQLPVKGDWSNMRFLSTFSTAVSTLYHSEIGCSSIFLSTYYLHAGEIQCRLSSLGEDVGVS